MKERKEVLNFGLTFPDVYVDAPFHGDNWVLLRYRKNKKTLFWMGASRMRKSKGWLRKAMIWLSGKNRIKGIIYHMSELLIEEGEEERCKAYLIRDTTDMKTGKSWFYVKNSCGIAIISHENWPHFMLTGGQIILIRSNGTMTRNPNLLLELLMTGDGLSELFPGS